MVFHFRSEHPEWLHGLDQNEAVRTMKERLQRLAKLCESHIAVPVQKATPASVFGSGGGVPASPSVGPFANPVKWREGNAGRKT